jgi:hypothetical protein
MRNVVAAAFPGRLDGRRRLLCPNIVLTVRELKPPQRALLPVLPEQLALLDPSLAREIIDRADRADQRNFIYALVALSGGIITFLASIASFVFLVIHGQRTAAASLLGASVLAIVGTLIRARLRLKELPPPNEPA